MHKLTEMTIAEKVELYNDGVDTDIIYGEHLYSMNEFDEIMYGKTAWEVACMTFYGNFNPGNAVYFMFDGYGNLKSFDEYEIEYYLDDYADDLKAMASYYND